MDEEIHRLIRRYIALSPYAKNTAAMHSAGHPLWDEEGVIFTLQGVCAFVRKAGVNVTVKRLTTELRTMRATPIMRVYKQKRYRCWLLTEIKK